MSLPVSAAANAAGTEPLPSGLEIWPWLKKYGLIHKDRSLPTTDPSRACLESCPEPKRNPSVFSFRTLARPEEDDLSKWFAVIVQACGTEQGPDDNCDSCVEVGSPDGCVTAEGMGELVGEIANHACAECLFRGRARFCSLSHRCRRPRMVYAKRPSPYPAGSPIVIDDHPRSNNPFTQQQQQQSNHVPQAYIHGRPLLPATAHPPHDVPHASGPYNQPPYQPLLRAQPTQQQKGHDIQQFQRTFKLGSSTQPPPAPHQFPQQPQPRMKPQMTHVPTVPPQLPQKRQRDGYEESVARQGSAPTHQQYHDPQTSQSQSQYPGHQVHPQRQQQLAQLLSSNTHLPPRPPYAGPPHRAPVTGGSLTAQQPSPVQSAAPFTAGNSPASRPPVFAGQFEISRYTDEQIMMGISIFTAEIQYRKYGTPYPSNFSSDQAIHTPPMPQVRRPVLPNRPPIAAPSIVASPTEQSPLPAATPTGPLPIPTSYQGLSPKRRRGRPRKHTQSYSHEDVTWLTPTLQRTLMSSEQLDTERVGREGPPQPRQMSSVDGAKPGSYTTGNHSQSPPSTIIEASQPDEARQPTAESHVGMEVDAETALGGVADAAEDASPNSGLDDTAHVPTGASDNLQAGLESRDCSGPAESSEDTQPKNPAGEPAASSEVPPAIVKQENIDRDTSIPTGDNTHSREIDDRDEAIGRPGSTAASVPALAGNEAATETTVTKTEAKATLIKMEPGHD